MTEIYTLILFGQGRLISVRDTSDLKTALRVFAPAYSCLGSVRFFEIILRLLTLRLVAVSPAFPFLGDFLRFYVQNTVLFSGIFDSVDRSPSLVSSGFPEKFYEDIGSRLLTFKKVSTSLKAFRKSGVPENESGLTGPMVMKEYSRLLMSKAE